MEYNKNIFSKVNDRKVLHKVKKQWIVMSMAMFALLGGGAVVHEVSAHAGPVNHIDNNQSSTLRERLNYQLNQSDLQSQTKPIQSRIVHGLSESTINRIGYQADQLHDRIIQNSARLNLVRSTSNNSTHNLANAQSSHSHRSNDSESTSTILPGYTGYKLNDNLESNQLSQSNEARGNGVNLDCARIYYTPQQIEQYINLIHNNNGQYLQLHLTDDQNFGIYNNYLHNNKANGYLKDGTWYNKQTHQPFLTKSDLKSIVNYGKSQDVAVYPEFEMPAHSAALIKLVQLAYGNGVAHAISAGNSSQLDFENLPGISREQSPDTLDVIKSILSEYFFLPKGTRFGLGGDEITGNLADASKAGGTTLSALVRFYNNIDNFLTQHGYRSVVYNDAFVKQPGLSGPNYYNKDIAVNYWSQSGNVSDGSRNSSAVQNLQYRYSMNDLTNLGYKVINNNANYLDLVATSDNNCKKRTAILKQWTPGTWYGDNPNEKDDSPNVLGSAISIWSSDTAPYSSQQTIKGVAPFINTFFTRTNQNSSCHPRHKSPNHPAPSVNEIIRFETVQGSYVGDELISGQSGRQFNWSNNQSDIPNNYQLSNDGTQDFRYGVTSHDGLDKTIDHQVIHVVHVKSSLNNQIPVSDDLVNVIGLVNLHFNDGNGHDKVVPLNYAKQMTAKDGYNTDVLHDLTNISDQVDRPSDLLSAESNVLDALGINSSDYSYDSTDPNNSQSGSNGDYDKYGITSAQAVQKNEATAAVKGATFNFYFKGNDASKYLKFVDDATGQIVTPARDRTDDGVRISGTYGHQEAFNNGSLMDSNHHSLNSDLPSDYQINSNNPARILVDNGSELIHVSPKRLSEIINYSDGNRHYGQSTVEGNDGDAVTSGMLDVPQGYHVNPVNDPGSIKIDGKSHTVQIVPNSSPVTSAAPAVLVYYHLNSDGGQVLNSGSKLELNGAVLKASDVNKIATVPNGYTLESNESNGYPVNGNTVINLIVVPKSISSDSIISQQGVHVTMLYKNHDRVVHSSDQYISASDLGKYGANKIGDHYTILAPNSHYKGYQNSSDQSLVGAVTPNGLTHSAVTFIYKAIPKKVNVQYRYGNLKKGQSSSIQADPGSDITVNPDTVPDGFHLVSGQRLVVPSDSNSSDNVSLNVAPNDDSSYVTVNLVYKVGNRPVQLVDNLPVPINLEPGQAQTISADSPRFMKPGFEPVSSDFVISYQNDPSKYPQMNHTYVYEAQPVDIRIAYKDGRQFVKKDGSLVNNENQLNSSDYTDLGDVGINGQDIDVHADNGAQIGMITGQGLYNKDGVPVGFKVPTGYHLSHDDNLITVSPSVNPSGVQQTTAEGVPVMTLALSGGAVASNQNTVGAPITIRYINEDNGQEVGDTKVLDGNLGTKADVTSSDASQNETAGMNIPNGYILDTNNLPGHPDCTDPRHPLYQFTSTSQTLNLPVQGMPKQFTLHLHVILGCSSNQAQLLDDVPIRISGRIGQDFTVSPYGFKGVSDGSVLAARLPNQEFEMPKGCHATNSDDDLTVRINSDGAPSAKNVFYFYQRNSVPKTVGTVRIHYVTDSDHTVRNHVNLSTGNLTDGNEIDQVSDRGIADHDQFNLVPYLNDIPENVGSYYQPTGHVFGTDGGSIPDQQWYFIHGDQDIYIQVQPKNIIHKPIIID